MRRRELIGGLGSAVLWPFVVQADQPVMPVVGFLNSQSARDYQHQVKAFLEALAEAGYVDGRNVKIEYRWAESHSDRLPIMMADLVDKKVAVIAATTLRTNDRPTVRDTGRPAIRLFLQISPRMDRNLRTIPTVAVWPCRCRAPSWATIS